MKIKPEKKKPERKMRKAFMLTLAVAIAFIGVLPAVMAHCPLCTGATIVGVGITRSFGLDDSIVGVFVGGMIISTALWFNNVLKKRNIGIKGNEKLRLLGLIILTSILTLVTFYYAGLFGRGNEFRIFGIESILVGSFSGGILSLGAFYYSNYLKNKNGGKVLFNYQTMIISLIALIVNAGLFALLL
ncbi:hypothetical protein COX97_02535 [Candidatus Pacearchaeota archaeon CG_4_10_14_0_2_um_filter_05_32_18]|nr:MAG: hypothetical protein COX97_02535 [Candidatus Pacearchaeota archaeon CG_4_10_14_0_2_um_filter_05_32_18]